MTSEKDNLDPEINAISKVYGALRGLDADSQTRVLNYVAQKLNVPAVAAISDAARASPPDEAPEQRRNEKKEDSKPDDGDDLEGISPIAKKWMARNGLQAGQLSKMFSLGVDEIDLIARTVPGAKKKERMHNVFLLKGVAAYLGTGTPRFTHEQLKEASLHYDAYDVANFASYFKTMTGDISGNKESGYALTARGLSNATDLVKEMAAGGKAS